MSVIVVGSINQDIVVGAPKHPRVGETIMGNSLAYFPGGKGANQAVAAARAGAEAVMCGMVGDDPAGQSLKSFLSYSGVDTGAIGTSPDLPTGTAIITVAEADNTIVVVAGANARVDGDVLNRLELSTNDIVVAQYETPLDATLTAFRRATTAGARTVLNPAPAALVPKDLLALTTVLVVNEHELDVAFNLSVNDIVDADSIELLRSNEQLRCLVVTLGRKGCMVAEQGNVTMIAGRSVDAVDSTGAGDCFVGYLCAELERGRSVLEAVTTANAAAAVSVTRHGAAVSIPALSEVLTA